MHRLLELLRSLGPAGALENAGALAEARRREDWVLALLDRRLGDAGSAGAAVAAPLRRTA